MDPSEKMLSVARMKNKDMDWISGSAENLPLTDNSIEGVVATLTIHHWKNLSRAFSEIHRVLKPEGKVVLFTSTPEQMKGYWLNRYFPRMMADSIKQMPELKVVKDAMSVAGIGLEQTVKYCVQPDLEDKFLYFGKDKPEIYMDPEIRHGISSFSSLANSREIEEGLDRLHKDIVRGTIGEVMRSYENDTGDYLFVLSSKSKVEQPR